MNLIDVTLKKCPALLTAAWAFAFGLTISFAHAATPANTLITNIATASYSAASGVVTTLSASAVVNTSACSPAKVELMQYIPASAPVGVGTMQFVPAALSSTTGAATGPFVTASGPIPLGKTAPLAVNGNIPLAVMTATSSYSHGEPVFVRVTSFDQNKNPLVADTIIVNVSTVGGDSETLQLTETGVSTGVFSGYIQSAMLALNSVPVKNDNVLSLNVIGKIKETITASNVDVCNGVTSTSAAQALADPFGLVFSSVTGLPINGATITIIDVASGLPAKVFGNDGVSPYPSTMTSGSTVKDSSGATYVMQAGMFRFPMVAPGNYKFQITPASGYRAPSTVATATLQTLPGNPFAVVVGSRGENFIVNPGPAVNIDIPLDPGTTKLSLTKTVGKQVAAVGDYVPYTLGVTNNDVLPTYGALIADHIPLGFRYQAGSTTLNGVATTDPTISPDARTLTFTVPNIAPNATINIQYVLAITPAAPMGVASNTAVATGIFVSNTAVANMTVKQDLFANTAILIGRVIDGSCDDKVDNDLKGLAGARVLLENGTQILTDKEGRWHMDNIRPGTHVVQLDLDSLPKNYEVVACQKNSRFAGRAYSQFVNLQGGTLWRADFHVQKKAPVALRLTQTIGAKSVDEKTLISLSILSATEVTGYSATIILPPNTKLIPGSATLNGETIADPEVSNQALTFRSLARPAQWQDLYFIEVEDVGPSATFKSMVRFTPPGRSAISAPVAVANVLHHAPATNGTYAEVLVEPDDLRPAKTTADDDISSLVEKLPYDDEWLARAEPGTEWLHPQENFHPNLPAISIAVKHDPKEQVRIEVNGKAVNGLSFYGTRYNAARTVALSSWRAVSIQPGDNRIEMILTDAQGNEASVVRIIHYGDELDHVEFVPEKSRLIADGKTRPVIAVRFLDKAGKPIRRGINGEFDLGAPYSSYDRREGMDRQPLNGRVGGKARYEIKQDGLALIELQPTTQSGEAVLNFQFRDNRQQEVRAWLQAQQRDWVLVGFGEGTLGQKTLTGNIQALQASSTDTQLFDKDKLAFYAKGSIKGEYLMTIAYDTAKVTGQNILGQAIDPNQYYTLYADATQASFDAASASRLYVKVERKQFYAMFGDFNTGLSVTELSRYSRTLNGIKSEYKGDTVGYNAFATQTTQAYVKDEIQGNGTSGLYQLTRNNITINTDKIHLETRDRFQSQNIISTQVLTRYLDYNIDYNLGTIFFTQAVQSRDGAFNPTYIVAEYESNASLDSRVTAGGRASVKPIKNLEVGATLVHEGNVGATGNLQGTDVTYKLDNQTKIHAEGAATNRNISGTSVSGAAWAADVTHREERWDAKAYLREQGGSFGMGQQNTVENATRKIGADGRYKLTDSTRLGMQTYQLDNITTGDKTTMLEGRVDAQITAALSSYYGVRRTQTQSVLFNNTQSEQILAGTAYSMLDNKLTLRASGEAGVGTVAATAGNATMPNRITLGADYKVTQQSKVFAEQEFANGQQISSSTTRVGVRTQPWSGAEMSASVGDQFNNDAERIYGNMGLVQRWQITEHWQTDFSVDRSTTFRNTVSPAQVSNAPLPSGTMPLPNGQMSDYIATAFGAAYRESVWSANGRVELRNSTLAQQKNIRLGSQRSLDAGRSVSAGLTLINSYGASTSNNADLRVSYAHRPNDSEWVWFDRADYVSQFNQTAAVVFKSKKFVNNANANWMPNTRTQLSLQYGAKYVIDNIGGLDYSGYTDLSGAELRYDLNEDWDIGGFASMMRSVSVGVKTYGLGSSLGYKLIDNMWLSFGYNVRGMTDRDFANASYRARGPFVTLRMKVDQETFGLNDHGEKARPLTAE